MILEPIPSMGGIRVAPRAWFARLRAPAPLDGGALLELRLAGEDEPFAAVQTREDGTFAFRVDVEPVESD